MSLTTILFALGLWIIASVPIGILAGRYLHRISHPDPAPSPGRTFKCPKPRR